MKKLKAAVVGVGHLGRHHARWYQNLSGSELVGVYDIDANRAKEIADGLKTKVFASLDEMAEECDIASVVTSTAKHYEVGSYLLKKGVHCLIEKPLAATLEQAEELMKLSKEHSCLLTVGHIERFNPAFQAALGRVQNPKFIEGHRLAAFNPRGADVAVILDLMIHDIDLCLALNPGAKIKSIAASAVKVVSQSDDICNARLAFDNGCVANLTASRISLNAMRKLRVFQNEAYFSIDLAERKADCYQLDKNSTAEVKIPIGNDGQVIAYEKLNASGDDQLSSELSSFVAAVAEGSNLEVTAEQGLEALKIALEIERVASEASAL